MDEQEPEERAGEAPLEQKAEPAEESQAPELDSARDELAQSNAAVPVDTAGEEPAAAATTPALEAPAATEGGEQQAVRLDEEPAPQEVEQLPVEAARPTPPAPSGLRGGRLTLGEAAPEASSEPAWYVIHCYSGYENKVRHNLEQRIETMGMKDKIFDVVIPTQEEIEVRDGKRRTVERHIFPGYVLVNMSLSEESWYVVRNTPGVTGFVGMGNLPTALRPEEVSQIIKRMEAEAPTVKVSFKVGERVRIIDGPFNDFRGTVSDIDMERTKVRVMVSFFGRETPVELDFLQVEKA